MANQNNNFSEIRCGCTETEFFVVKDCALTTMATGIKAQNLKEFRNGILSVTLASIYQHFWGRLLRPRFDEPEYNNDFASWAYHSLHEKPLAERLSIINPAETKDLEELRWKLLEVVEDELEKKEYVPWTKADQQFHFLHSSIVVFDTGIKLDHPGKLAETISELSTGSIFYHFIDARQRTPGHCDDFSYWLSFFGDECKGLAEKLQYIDPFFSSLKEIRYLLSSIFKDYFSQ